MANRDDFAATDGNAGASSTGVESSQPSDPVWERLFLLRRLRDTRLALDRLDQKAAAERERLTSEIQSIQRSLTRLDGPQLLVVGSKE
jgi:hypothetical protein